MANRISRYAVGVKYNTETGGVYGALDGLARKCGVILSGRPILCDNCTGEWNFDSEDKGKSRAMKFSSGALRLSGVDYVTIIPVQRL